jgi:hypothetical protein
VCLCVCVCVCVCVCEANYGALKNYSRGKKTLLGEETFTNGNATRSLFVIKGRNCDKLKQCG